MTLDPGRRRLKRAVARARTEGRHVPSVVIVGAGLSGLGAGIQLLSSGLTELTIVEQSSGVGGTWRDNRYPGSGCDVPSQLYSFSFAPKSDWTRRFARQAEILAYAEECVQRFELAPHICLGTTVQAASFDEQTCRWRVTVRSSESGVEDLWADAVIFACGQLNRPAIPELDGLDSFAGPSWHSARWDHEVDLAGKRVAVVGNGASAVQFVPTVADLASSVTVFQRSANYVVPKTDRKYGGLQRWLLQRVRVYRLAYRWWIYWTLEARWLYFRKDSFVSRKVHRLMTNGIRQGVVSERLPDALVVPDYPVGCKRILISNEWYPTLLKPNVEVVASPIGHVEPSAIVTTDGRRHPADVIVFGTGFHTTSFLSDIPVTGRRGTSLASVWREGARAYRGTLVTGFPNLFLLYGPNTNLGHNSILFMVERQINLMLQCLALQAGAGSAGAGASVEVTADAYTEDDSHVQRLAAKTAWVGQCRSWYKDAAGRVTNNWPTWTVRYWSGTLSLRRADVTLASAPAGPQEP